MEFYVEKDTDLMRSTLVAVGLGELFQQLPGAGSGMEVRLRDAGSAYLITVPYELDDALTMIHERRAGRLPPLLPAIDKAPSAGDLKAVEKDPASPVRYKYVPRGFQDSFGSDRVIDYEGQKALAKAQRPAGKSKKEPREEGQVEALPHPDYPLWAHLCSYFGKGSAMRSVYPSILHAWYSHQGDQAEALLRLIVDAYSVYPNDLLAARAAWQSWAPQLEYQDYELETEVTAASIISPSTVQGASTHTGAKQLNNEPLGAFWLELYLAFAGYFVVGLPYNLGDDITLFYPLPLNISIEELDRQMRVYRESETAQSLYRFSNRMNRAKLDVLANLSFYKIRLKDYLDNRPGIDDDLIEVYSGLVGYFYRNNGGTQIPFDETVFSLPPFMHRTDAASTARVLKLLEAHHDLIAAVRGTPPKYALTADELTIFSLYRRFLTHGQPEDWWLFAIAYNRYRFVRMDNFYLPDLHLNDFKETLTLMDVQTDRKDYRPLLEDEGFQHIAAAINDCTVYLRYTKDYKKQQTAFRVWHGLGDDLLRNAHDSDAFVADLGRFLHDYARESSRVLAETGETRAFVTQDDLLSLMNLIATYGSSVVAHLLVAAGYSSSYTRKTD